MIFKSKIDRSNFTRSQENYYSKTFTTENGLPHNHVHSIAQDCTGFLWIATWDGLSRYDGYEFRNYYHNPGDCISLTYFICKSWLIFRIMIGYLFQYVYRNM